MPEASIDEDSNTLASKDKVRSNPNTLGDHRKVPAIAQALAVKD